MKQLHDIAIIKYNGV